MTEEKPKPQKIAMSNTKKEMLAAYQELLGRLETGQQPELQPTKRKEEKEKRGAVRVADALSTEGIGKGISELRSEVGKILIHLSDRIEEEVGKYRQVTKAVAAKEEELSDIYEIEKAALSLTALIDAEKVKRREYEADTARRKEQLDLEIEATREQWKRESEAHDAELKDRDEAEKRRWQRETEEFNYRAELAKKQTKEQNEYEKARLERDLALRREEVERELHDRETAMNGREDEIAQLRARVAAFPGELQAAIDRATQETTRHMKQEAEAREELTRKEFEGERNLLKSRVDALQKTVGEQSKQIARLSGQLERSYGQVQEIAVNAIAGPMGSMSRNVPVARDEVTDD